MDVLSNISQPSPISPYTQDNGTGGSGNASNQQYPCNSSSFNNNHSAGGGFTLLQGHIKLMAMVPHLPENHLSEKILRPSMQPAAPSNLPSVAPECHAYPCTSSHSLPPITPRMMPSTISQKYQQYLHNNQTFWNGSHARTFSHENGYPEQFPYSSGGPSWYPPNFTPESSCKLPPIYPHRQIAMMPSFEATANGNDFRMKPFMDTPAYLDSSQSCTNNPYHHPWLPLHLAYQQMMAVHSRSHFMQQQLNNHQYPQHFQHNAPYSNEAFPQPYSHPHQHPHFPPPYAAQSLPDFFTSAPAVNHFGMSPCLCQSCCSLPHLPPPPTSQGRPRTKSKKKHRNSPQSPESDDVFVVVEESEDTTSSSSSTSLSSADEPKIVPKTATKPTPIVASPQHEETSKIDTNLDEKENKSETEIASTAKGKKTKEPPLVVTVHDCFASDSSEAEIDPDASSDLEKGPHFRKKKLPLVKPMRKAGANGGGNIHVAGNGKVFEDLDNDLSPDEVRTYTSEYLVELLTSQDWNNCYIALQMIVRFARHRPQALINYLTGNGVILWYTFNHITSPKSALCRAAIVTFKELFVRIPTSMDNQIDKITEKLVMKSLAPNNFIRKECDEALMAMVENCNLAKILTALENIRKKQHTRAAGLKVTLARMALQIILTAGVDNCLMNQPYAEKLLPMLFCFMMEPNIEIRSFAKQALSMLMNHLQFESAVMRHVSFDRNSTEVFKKLDKMRGRNRKLK